MFKDIGYFGETDDIIGRLKKHSIDGANAIYRKDDKSGKEDWMWKQFNSAEGKVYVKYLDKLSPRYAKIMEICLIAYCRSATNLSKGPVSDEILNFFTFSQILRMKYQSKAVIGNIESILIRAFRPQIKNSDSGNPSFEDAIKMIQYLIDK
uniref:Replicative DNA helicase n=1 Tax=Rhabditophanes sp. KR3021 TaxID=114890 RepID=A0AC35UHW2_9BILA